MLAIASLDIDSPNPTVQRIISALPECFNAKKETGPIPLSVILEQTKVNASDEFDGNYFPHSYDAVPDWIPVVELAYEGCEADIERSLPSSISSDTKIGQVVTYNDEQFVVVENNRWVNFLTIAPAECILVDCELVPWIE